MREQILQDIKESIIAISMELLHAGKDWFTQLSYEKWALLEIQDLILQNPEASPWDIVEEFINLMDRYSLLYLIPIITSFVSLMTPLGQSWWS